MSNTMVNSKQITIEEPQKPTVAIADNLSSYADIAVDLIDDPEQPMRTDISVASVEELISSMRQIGIIEPIVVKPKNGRYEVIAGHRRTFAARIAQLMTVPCIIRDVDNDETEIMKIHENLYRQDIRPAEEAKHYDALIKRQKLTPAKIANIVGRSLSYITDRLDILNYPQVLLEALESGSISFSVSRQFARFSTEKEIRSAVYYAQRGGMTAEMAKKWVDDAKRSKESPILQNGEITNPATGTQEVTHHVECVYCGEQLRLFDASVVYIHPACHSQAAAPSAPQQSEAN